MSETLAAWAQRYATGNPGWRVMPCHATTTERATAKAPRISNWKQRATTDPATIRAWWHKWPDALIGVIIPDHLIVIDVDPRNGGSLDGLEELAGGPLPETLTCKSGRGDGGRHYYFRKPGGPIRGGGEILPGIDVLTDRYVIAPPSLHPATGKPYSWERLTAPAPLPTGLARALAPLPTTLAPVPCSTAVLRRSRGRYSPEERLEILANVKEGKRNSALFHTALTAFRERWPEAASRLEAAALQTGLTVSEIRPTIDNARRYAHSPRHPAGTRREWGGP